MIEQLVQRVLSDLLNGKYMVSLDEKVLINKYVTDHLNGLICNRDTLVDIIKISNILYNNTSINVLLLEDGIYDILVSSLNIVKQTPIGAPPVIIEYTENDSNIESSNVKLKDAVRIIPDECELGRLEYANTLFSRRALTPNDVFTNPVMIHPMDNRRTTLNKAHNYPKLVGTLDKAKFVLNSEAEERGVISDSNVSVLERDFFAKHIQMGILNPNRVFSIIAMLKYDGVSVEGDMYNYDYSSRGDAIEGHAADLTHKLRNYVFPNALCVEENERFGIKFEAIMTYQNLQKYNELKGKNYKNCRTAISGLFSSLDAYKYMDLVTLVPLSTSMNIPAIDEIVFMNKYYSKDVPMIYTVISGNYQQVLFQIKQWVAEAEYARDFMNFMYDGVVIKYLDEDLVNALGRVDAVDKFAIAVKFNAMKKSTVFTGYYYTVGQDGCITPMINYNPVEFFGTIHDKSTGHSFERFKQLSLKVGDIIDIEYVNDVMPYVTKPMNEHNIYNTNPVEMFITHCPVCGEELSVSMSGKTIYCTNLDCSGRKAARVVNMLQKLNLKDFSYATIEKLNKFSLKDLVNTKLEELYFLGPKVAQKFLDRMNELTTKPIKDYDIIGSLGFDNIGRRKWKLVLKHATIQEILNIRPDILLLNLTNIKGIGSVIASTIVEQMNYFREDLELIASMNNVVPTKGTSDGFKIRFTGCRDKELMLYLQDNGYDCTDGNVTRDTGILLVPSKDFKSSKLNKVGPNCGIVPLSEFKANMSKYISI